MYEIQFGISQSDGDSHAWRFSGDYHSCRNHNARNGLFVGPETRSFSEQTVGDAAFVWRRSEFRRTVEEGVECTLFRNEACERVIRAYQTS